MRTTSTGTLYVLMHFVIGMAGVPGCQSTSNEQIAERIRLRSFESDSIAVTIDWSDPQASSGGQEFVVLLGGAELFGTRQRNGGVVLGFAELTISGDEIREFRSSAEGPATRRTFGLIERPEHSPNPQVAMAFYLSNIDRVLMIALRSENQAALAKARELYACIRSMSPVHFGLLVRPNQIATGEFRITDEAKSHLDRSFGIK
jgi:hypothetical protein